MFIISHCVDFVEPFQTNSITSIGVDIADNGPFKVGWGVPSNELAVIRKFTHAHKPVSFPKHGSEHRGSATEIIEMVGHRRPDCSKGNEPRAS